MNKPLHKYNYIYKVCGNNDSADFTYAYAKELMPDIIKHSTMIEMCEILSNLSHCISIRVASLIVKEWRIISTGINGTAPTAPNCDEVFNFAYDSFDRSSHHEWSTFNELHSEQNAIAIAAKNGININNSDMYLTLSPCVNCAKLISASGIQNIFFTDIYDMYENTEWYKILDLNKINIYRVAISPL